MLEGSFTLVSSNLSMTGDHRFRWEHPLRSITFVSGIYSPSLLCRADQLSLWSV